MQVGKFLTAQITEFTALLASVAPLLAEMPHAAADHEALAASIARIRVLLNEQEAHTARLRETNRQRFEEHARARDLRNRLVGHLVGKLGPSSPLLLEHGLKPRKRTRRARPTPEQPAGTAPARASS